MSLPSVGTYASVFEAIRRYRPHHDSLHNVLVDFVDGIGDAEARLLPKSVADIMPLLKSDIHRLRFASEFLTRLDLYEAAAAVFSIAVQTRDQRLLLSAASLAGNPAVESSLRDRIDEYAGHDRMVMIRLSSDIVPSSQDEELLHLQCWPGARTADGPLRFAPVIVLDVDLPPAQSLKLATMFIGIGATIRRLNISATIPHWFGNQTVLLCTSESASLVLSKYPKFAPDRVFTESLPSQSNELTQLMYRIYNSVPKIQCEQEPVLDEVKEPKVSTTADSKSYVDLFNPPFDAERLFEQIELARTLKKEAAKRAQKRYDDIAAMPPLKTKNDHVVKLSSDG